MTNDQAGRKGEAVPGIMSPGTASLVFGRWSKMVMGDILHSDPIFRPGIGKIENGQDQRSFFRYLLSSSIPGSFPV